MNINPAVYKMVKLHTDEMTDTELLSFKLALLLGYDLTQQKYWDKISDLFTQVGRDVTWMHFDTKLAIEAIMAERLGK